MASRPEYVHINLNGNEIQNVLLERLAAHPAAVEGRIYYNTTDKIPYIYNGTSWVDLEGGVKTLVDDGNGIVTVTNIGGAYTINFDPVDIDHSAITDDEIAKHRTINDAATSATDLFSAEKILQLFNNASSSAQWQVSALSYVADNTAAPATEVSGDRYVLSHDGGVPHIDYDGAIAGDIVEFDGAVWVADTPALGTHIAVQDDNTAVYLWVGAAWQKQEWENTPDATEAVAGKIRIATVAEIVTATDNTIAVTPAGLDTVPYNTTYSGAVIWTGSVGNYSAIINPATHGLSAARLLVQAYVNDVQAGFEISCTAAGIVTISANTNPSNTEIVITGAH